MLNLTYYRIKAGLTIRELANIEYNRGKTSSTRKTSNPTTISLIETGKLKKPTLSTLVRIAEVLSDRIGEELDPNDLLKNKVL